VVEARFLPGASAAAVTVQRSLGAALQFVGPAASGSTVTRTATTWTTAEHDATGKYQAEYRVAAETGHFSKRKLRYDSVLLGLESTQPSVRLAPPLPNLTPEIVGSTADLAVEGGTLGSVKQSEELSAKLGQGMPVTSKTSLALVLNTSRREKAAPEWAQAGAATVRVQATEPYAPPAPPLETDAAKMAGWTFERAVAELEDLERTRQPPEPAPEGGLETQSAEQNARAQRASRAFGALGAILRRDPKAVTRVVALVRKKSVASQALLDALSSSASGLSQSALVELATDAQLPEKLRKSAAGSLIRTDAPSEKTVTALSGLLDDPVLDVHATYGLGTYARKLRDGGESERSRKISELLVRRLGAATTEGEKITIMRGIANSGYVGALEAVRPYLTNENASLRAAAVQALRLMNHPEVDQLIAERLVRERKALVRNAALSALSPRPVTPALLAAVERVASTSEDSQGRMEAVRLLGRWVREGTSVRATLDKVARNDAEARVRDEARRLLERS
jgi:hypothetical protein